MNLQTILNSMNATLMLGGLALLLLGVVVSAVRLWRGYVRSGFFSVVVVLGACILVGASLVRTTFPALAGAATPAAQGAHGDFFGTRGGPNGQLTRRNGAAAGQQRA